MSTTRLVVQAARELIEEYTGQSLDFLEIKKLRQWYIDKWYDEWEPANDLSFYERKDYLWLMLNCYTKFSSHYCKLAIDWVYGKGEFGTVLDMYAGAGMTSCHLSMSGSCKTVFCHTSGHQAELAIQLAKRLKCDIRVIDQPIICDTLVTFECLEHFEEPWKELQKFLPTKRIISTYSFGVPSVGHMSEFVIDGEVVRGKGSQTRRINKHLRADGWEVVKRFHMNRPVIQEKE